MNDAALAGGILSLGVGFLAAVTIGAWIAGAVGLWIGGKVTSLERATPAKALGAAAVTFFLTIALSLVLSILPLVGNLLGWLAGIVASVVIVQSMFECELGPAALCVLLKIGFEMAATGASVVAFFGGIGILAALFGGG